MIDRAFGDALREARSRRGISQEDLAARAGLHRTYVSQLERGLKSPSLRTIFQLTDALEVEPVELVRSVQQAMVRSQKRSDRH